MDKIPFEVTPRNVTPFERKRRESENSDGFETLGIEGLALHIMTLALKERSQFLEQIGPARSARKAT